MRISTRNARHCFELERLTAASWLSGLLCAAVALSGCAGAQTRAAAPSPALYTTPTSIATFVAKAPLGEAVAMPADAEHPAVKVQVISAYHAASGRSCRQYLLIDQVGRGQPHLACDVGQGWADVRPLVLDEATTPPPVLP